MTSGVVNGITSNTGSRESFPNPRSSNSLSITRSFNTVYKVEELRQVPNITNTRAGRETTECFGCDPHVFGIFDDKGRMMVIINWNTDLGDAWEYAENSRYPLDYSTYAYRMGANFIVYAMTRR